MDGEVQPKFGLMLSLMLMNLTALVLFFFATPTQTTEKKASMRIESNNSENVQMVRAEIAEMVMAGDADNKPVCEDETVILMMTPPDAQKGEGLIPQKKISKSDMKDPRLSLAEVPTLNLRGSLAGAQTPPGNVEIDGIASTSNATKKMSKAEETSDRQVEPPLAVALKKFVGNTGSGVRIFFDGLKNGYTKKNRESPASKSCMKSTSTERVVNVDCEPSLQWSKVNPPTNMKIKKPSHVPSPTQNVPEPTPSWIWGPWEDGSTSNQDAIPTDIVMDVLTRTQTRTNELIYLFSKKVVPAIERMNDKVADAIRLEKNLDSYTSVLIDAINYVVCPNSDTDMKVKHKNSKPGTNAGVKHTKAFSSDLSLMRDSRIRDYVGSFGKGERRPLNKRPVFKTLAARCWHTRNKRTMSRKNKKYSGGSEQLIMPEYSKVQLEQSNEGQLDKTFETRQYALEKIDPCEPKDDLANPAKEKFINNPVNEVIEKDFLKFTRSPVQRTIGIEEVLALNSSFGQSSDQGIDSDRDMQPFLSPLNLSSDVSMSLGMVERICVTEPPEIVYIRHNRTENKSKNVALNSDQTGSPESTSSLCSELHEGSTGHARQHVIVLGSDFSVVCDSRVQDYDSYIVQKESSSTVAAYSPEKGETQLMGSSETIAADSKVLNQQQRESNHSISFSGNMKNTMDLVNTFQQLNLQQKEVAMDNFCLLVLRIFEAWTESERSISSLRLSRIALSAWPSTDEVSYQTSRPRTAICRPRIDSVQEQESVMNTSLPKDSKLDKPTPNEITMDLDQTSTAIAKDLLQTVVEAAELLIAERSLVGVKTNSLQNPPLKRDTLKGCTDRADQSGFGDINETIIADGEVAASFMSKSHESIKVSKESSAATFYTDQPESSEDAFYECVSTMSTGTYGSLELEVEDSSNVFLERIQEEGTRVRQNEDVAEANPAMIVEPQTARSSFSIQSWLTDSGEELRTAKYTLDPEFPASDNSSFDVACSSMDLSTDESKADQKPKKKIWGVKFIKKILKKKSKPSSRPNMALSKNASRSQTDSVFKPSDQTGESTQ